MAVGKRYYWLKLHDDFFDSKRIKKLRKMAGGDTYTIIYLKMQLLAMKTDGILKWTGLEPNISDELALDLDESPEDVNVTLSYLLACGLAETSDDINFFFPFAVSNTGSEGASAKRVRDHRDRVKALQCNTEVTQVKQMCNVEIEKEKEKEIETRDRDREKSKPTRHKHGLYQNVLLTDEDFETLKSEFPSDWELRIERLSEYIASTGKSYKNHLATIRSWARKDASKKSEESKTGNVFLEMLEERSGMQ